jgi:hypothetical protein
MSNPPPPITFVEVYDLSTPNDTFRERLAQSLADDQAGVKDLLRVLAEDAVLDADHRKAAALLPKVETAGDAGVPWSAATPAEKSSATK